MWLRSVFGSLRAISPRSVGGRIRPGALPKRRRTPLLAIEGLETRCLLSSMGVYALGDPTPGRSIPQAVLANPDVDGIAVRVRWNTLEGRGDRVYDWSDADNKIAAAVSAGKEVSLSVEAGVNTPSWVYATGVPGFTFIDRKTPTPQTIPIPWSPIFLAKWTQFTRDLAQHYSVAAPILGQAITQVKITGLNTTTQETALPHSHGETACAPAGAPCWTTSDDVSHWQSLPADLRYTRTRVLGAWQTMADTFAHAFPRQQIAVMLFPGAFPPLDDLGNRIPGQQTDSVILDEFINQGIARYGSQFIVQNNGLSAYSIWSNVEAVANQVTTGYQMLWFVTNDSTYRMNQGQPGDIAQILQQAVDRGVAANAKFLEIYAVDVANPALSAVIANAHANLVDHSHVSAPAGTTFTLTAEDIANSRPFALPDANQGAASKEIIPARADKSPVEFQALDAYWATMHHQAESAARLDLADSIVLSAEAIVELVGGAIG